MSTSSYARYEAAINAGRKPSPADEPEDGMDGLRDGTQERTLDPPDDTLSDAELRACERAARDGFDAMDERAKKWLDEQLADAPQDVAQLARYTVMAHEWTLANAPILRDHAAARIRDRYIAECAEDYWPDLMDQAAHAQEER